MFKTLFYNILNIYLVLDRSSSMNGKRISDAKITIKGLGDVLNEDDKFIDIGANIGTYSILSTTMVGCETISFEPSNQIFRILENNVQINNVESKINLYKVKLSLTVIGKRSTKPSGAS